MNWIELWTMSKNKRGFVVWCNNIFNWGEWTTCVTPSVTSHCHHVTLWWSRKKLADTIRYIIFCTLYKVLLFFCTTLLRQTKWPNCKKQNQTLAEPTFCAQLAKSKRQDETPMKTTTTQHSWVIVELAEVVTHSNVQTESWVKTCLTKWGRKKAKLMIKGQTTRTNV